MQDFMLESTPDSKHFADARRIETSNPKTVFECISRARQIELIYNTGVSRQNLSIMATAVRCGKNPIISLCQSVATTYWTFLELGANHEESLGLAQIQLELHCSVPFAYRLESTLESYRKGEVEQVKRILNR